MSPVTSGFRESGRGLAERAPGIRPDPAARTVVHLGGSPLLGAVWETFLFSEMRKLNGTLAAPFAFWYYRDQRAREIDCVLERGGQLSFVETKWQEKPGTDDARNLAAVHQDLGAQGGPWKRGAHYVIGTPAASYSIAPGLTAGALRDLARVFT